MNDVKVYSLSSEGEKNVTAHFKVKEFACNDGSDVVFISDELAQVLEKIREHFGQPVKITSGYRTVSYNKTINPKTADKSMHSWGLAADIKVNGYSPKTVRAYAETLMPDKGGIGLYSTFVHVDVRNGKARW